jgi:hypothetical protein
MTPCTVLEQTERTDTQALAHLVSCSVCLKRRTRDLGLPNNTNRMMDDISSRGDSHAVERNENGDCGAFHRSSRVPGAKPLRQAYSNRRREIFEHYPSEFVIAFDGQTHATLLLNAAQSTLNLSLEQKQCPDSIGILSEREVCLLVLDRKEIESSERKVYLVLFSEGRSLEVVITIHIAYRNPDFVSAQESAWNVEPINIEEKSLLVLEREPTRILGIPIHKWWSRILQAFPRFEKPTMNPTLATALMLALATTIFRLWGCSNGRPLSRLTYSSALPPPIRGSRQMFSPA